MIEPIIRAIFIHPKGSLAACEKFVKRIGLVSYLERVLADGIDIQHPKSLLGQLAGTETVTYQEEVVVERLEDTSEQRYMCKVTAAKRDSGT